MENKNIKILAIDDIKDNLITIKALIKESFPEAEIITGVDGQSGIREALTADPDVILLDIVMPGMDGFEVCRNLKKDAQTKNIPVIFLTAIRGDRESRIQALNAGAEAFLMKPIDEPELIAQVRAMVKIKESRIEKENENLRLEKLVALRTKELELELNERKKIEKELIKAKDKAEESEKLKTAFLANMSHEIRTPMNGILGFVDLLQSPTITTEQQGNYLEIIKKSSDRLLGTINDIIEISKIEAGQVPLNYTDVNINEIMLFLYRFFMPEAEIKGINFKLSTNSPVEPFRISTDKNKLESILTNFVKNAIKFTTKGTIELGYNTQGNTINFFIKDTGAGIPQNKLNAIFDRFVQADLGISRPYEGSGLGLAIANAYAKMLGGKISVESKENKGSTFKFSMDFQIAGTKTDFQPQKAEFSNFSTTENKILIVEDDDTSFNYLEVLLLNYNLHRATNGLEAIEMVQKTPDISLILMDLKMPLMDGYEATRKIKLINKNIPIIAQTAYALEGDRKKALDAGCDDYLTKPINKNEIRNKIEVYLSK